jgi:transposase
VVGALHETLQHRRREQQSPEFKLQMQQRNGIEGSISELVRGHGLRRARYKGLAKVDLQNQLVATACNIKRWLQKLFKAASKTGPEADLSNQRLLTFPTAPFSSALSCLLTRLSLFDFFSVGIA